MEKLSTRFAEQRREFKRYKKGNPKPPAVTFSSLSFMLVLNPAPKPVNILKIKMTIPKIWNGTDMTFNYRKLR